MQQNKKRKRPMTFCLRRGKEKCIRERLIMMEKTTKRFKCKNGLVRRGWYAIIFEKREEH